MITIGHIFYGQHKMLPLHEAAWKRHGEDSVLYTMIDDASPIPLPLSFGKKNLSIYRVEQDIPWNIAGARNLVFHTAKTEWVFCADVDHVVTPEALSAIMALDRSDPNIVYTFRRRARDGYVGVDAIINVLMNRARFFEMGGYDEDYSGHYGREETFFLRCLKHHNISIVRCDDIYLDWHPKFGGTWKLNRDKTFNGAIFEKKIEDLQAGRYTNPPILRFDWHLLETA